MIICVSTVKPGAGPYPDHLSVRRSPPGKLLERTKIKITFEIPNDCGFLRHALTPGLGGLTLRLRLGITARSNIPKKTPRGAVCR